MSKEELIEYGYEAVDAKIGTIYTYHNFVCLPKYDKEGQPHWLLFSEENDMTPLAEVNSIDDVKNAEKEWYCNQREIYMKDIKILDSIIKEYELR